MPFTSKTFMLSNGVESDDVAIIVKTVYLKLIKSQFFCLKTFYEVKTPEEFQRHARQTYHLPTDTVGEGRSDPFHSEQVSSSWIQV